MVTGNVSDDPEIDAIRPGYDFYATYAYGIVETQSKIGVGGWVQSV
jgi:hypothetical protein